MSEYASCTQGCGLFEKGLYICFLFCIITTRVLLFVENFKTQYFYFRFSFPISTAVIIWSKPE